jgi:cytochrome d ubiquinol oxidase subunit II
MEGETIMLQETWFLLIGVLLVGYAILDGFDLGAGMLHLFIARDDRDRRLVMNAIGPVWDGNEVWLLTAGGAIFAAFPKVYATVFSGLYLALMLLLVGLILRAVSLEFRSKVADPRWRASWDLAFAVGSFLPALLFGVAIGNVLRGLPLTADGEFAGTFLGLLNPFSVIVGLLSTAMFLMQGAAWLAVRLENGLRARAIRIARFSWLAFIALWVVATAFARVEAPRLFDNYTNALTWLAPLLFLASTTLFPILVARRPWAAWAASSLSIAMLIAIMGQALFPFMVPALGDPALGLTIRNASSTALTLRVMLVIALIGMPFVIGYTIWIYRNFRTPVVLDEQSY